MTGSKRGPGGSRPPGRAGKTPRSPATGPGGIAIGAGVVAFACYLATLRPTFGVVDSGELGACAWTLGIPHPSGYPTLMLLGWAVAHASPLRPILSLNLLAAVLTAGSVAALTLLYDHVLGAMGYPRARVARGLTAGLAAVATGLSGAWWPQAVGFEVYALHALFLAVVCLLFFRHTDALADGAPGRLSWRGSAFGFVLGLAFTNHLTTALLLPGLAVYFVLRLRSRALGHALALVPGFLIGVVPPYGFMMARAAARPRFDWGDPSTPGRLLEHVAGRDYRHAMGHLFDDVFLAQVAYFGHWLPAAVGYAGVVAGAAGIVVLLRRSRPLAAWCGVTFLVTVLAACSYNVNDIAGYFPAAVLALGVASTAAAGYLATRFGPGTALAMMLAIAGLTAGVNARENDERGNTITDDFARNMLEELPPNAIVFTKQWDFWVAGSAYLQEVEGVRRDVTVVDADRLFIDWYLNELERAHPEVMATVRDEADRVRRSARRAREGFTDAGDVDAYQQAYAGLFHTLIDGNLATRPCFLTYDDIPAPLTDGYARVPWGLVQRLVPGAGYVPADVPRYRFRMWRRHVVPQVVWTLKLYAEACQNRAAYEHAFGRDDLARTYAELALTFDPGFDPERVPDFPGAIEDQLAGELHRFRQAREDLARSVYPPW